jgi:hypothetical protein
LGDKVHWIVRENVLEAPPPGPGFTTVIFAVPGDLISEAWMSAVSFVALTHWVVRVTPFHWTTAPRVNCEPLTVIRKFDPLAVTGDGLTELICGSELGPSEG